MHACSLTQVQYSAGYSLEAICYRSKKLFFSSLVERCAHAVSSISAKLNSWTWLLQCIEDLQACFCHSPFWEPSKIMSTTGEAFGLFPLSLLLRKEQQCQQQYTQTSFEKSVSSSVHFVAPFFPRLLINRPNILQFQSLKIRRPTFLIF